MELTRFEDPRAFYDRAAPFLLEHEAAHNLPLGLCTTMLRHPERFDRPYLATVEAGGAVVVAAVMTPPHNLVLSLLPLAAVAPIAADAYRHYGTPPAPSPNAGGR